MAESVMGQGMGTWLKKECIGNSLRYLAIIYRLADGADFYLIEDNVPHAIKQIGMAKDFIDTVSEPELHKELDNALSFIKDNNYHDAFHALERAMDNTATKAFEKVVECQCGKSG